MGSPVAGTSSDRLERGATAPRLLGLPAPLLLPMKRPRAKSEIRERLLRIRLQPHSQTASQNSDRNSRSTHQSRGLRSLHPQPPQRLWFPPSKDSSATRLAH